MPKLKTKKSVSKRFRFTKKGKIKRSRAFRSHIRVKKSSKRKRFLRGRALVNSTDKKRIRNYLVEIGGEVKTRGVNAEGDVWKIGLDKPVENNFIPGRYIQAKLQIEDKSLATSGNYRKFYEKDGVKYVHSIDPKTGYPVLSNLLSATVLADDCMTADAYATAFMVMGIERAKTFLSNHKELEAYLIYSDDEGNYREFITEGLKENILE